MSRMSHSASPARVLAVALLLASLVPVSLPPTSASDGHPRSTGVIDVGSGGNLQAAIDQAQPGDTIRLGAGVTYTGTFTLPAKATGNPILIRTNAADSDLPPAGTRIQPVHFPLLARVVSNSGSVFTAAPGAHDFRFLGLEIAPATGTFLYNVITLGDGTETSVAQQPHDIAFERCYIHGDPVAGSRRGIALNGRSISVLDSRLSDFKEVGADSQALAGWSGAGPFTIVNNYLEGAAENLMFGGADPNLAGLVPADIVVRHNHFFKPLSWKTDDPSYAGTHWSVKNLFELKNARRVLVEGNVFEQNWADAQSGFSILFTVRNQDGTAPWSQVDHVVFQDNILRHGGAGFNILGYDNNFPSQQTGNVTIRNNLLYDVADTWGGNGAFLQLLDATSDIKVDHNTVLHSGNVITADGRPHTGFVFTNNIAPHNLYGVIGTNYGPGNSSLDVYFPVREFRRNLIPGASIAAYPADNFYPAGIGDIGFTDLSGGNYRLSDTSPYKNAGTDGKDVGADIPSVERATCGAVNGTYCPSSNPGGGGLPLGNLAGIPVIIILVAIAAVAVTLILVAWRRRRGE
ncbi:MAG: hypothetical protein E6K17_08725 [Methanobacteriota archaeon]|nr:MAG: hypothetical protein E6K17_08725 [Euryarchaeota archaeon]